MPDWTQHLRQRLAHLNLRGEREADIVEELSQHLDERYEELRRRGSSEPDACRIALDELVDPDTLVQHLQPLRQARVADTQAPGRGSGSILADLWADLRYAARTLRMQPGFAAVAILTLALGIGANSAIFALADATLLRPLPLREPERLAMLWETAPTTPRGGVSPLNAIDWAARSDTFEDIAAYIPDVGGMVMAGADGTAETVPRQWVTAGVFDVLGIDAIVGRTFRHEDDIAKRNAVVMTESFWHSRFQGDPAIVGTQVRLDGDLFTVLGVVPDSAQLIGRSSLWGLLSMHDAPPRARAARFMRAVGRLTPGATLEAAAADMNAVAEGLARDYPDTNRGRGVAVEPLQQAMVGSDLRHTALLFLGVVGFVLLICCANVANLLLARATVRSRELAIRAALGANRWRVVRQILTESLLLAALGCALGLALGAAILRVAPALIPDGLLPGAVTLAFDLRVVGFCIVAALGVGVLFGLAPAWQATRLSPAQAIGAETRGTTGRGGRLRGLLVVAEVAVAVVLLFGAGLLLRTLLAVETADRGYRADGALTMLVDPLGDRYPTTDSLLQFFDDIEREISAIHDVREVAWSSSLPLGEAAGQSFFEVEGAPPIPASERPAADYQVVSASYFSALEVAMRSGRAFDAGDRSGSVPVVIVNEAFVQTHLQGIAPVGTRIAVRASSDADADVVLREIIGVAEQVTSRATETQATPQMYVPLTQDPSDDMYLIVRSVAGRPEALTNPVRAAIASVDREQLVSVRDVMTLADVAWEATSRHRFRAVLVGTFAALALLLAMVGVFGILAYSVQQRTRDYGVRMALGATANDVLRLVVRGAAGLIATGTAVGFACAMLMSRWLESALYGVEALDPLTFAGVVLLLALAAALSTLGPAWRAARLHPDVALRG
ncbi:ABC transporter permease [Chiayiivirga flava]|uniref:Putative ABC transport system permease protein n=1 Tax=Chiayiivirga flava TaxID=659595 RepID=A0A7W8FZP9_9GAMM|nr:ABC transporter permease [Chiayiivirga flava]MBB5206873.1 putative ABC transport system permease protein [Chiayiivirga flava]